MNLGDVRNGVRMLSGLCPLAECGECEMLENEVWLARSEQREERSGWASGYFDGRVALRAPTKAAVCCCVRAEIVGASGAETWGAEK